MRKSYFFLWVFLLFYGISGVGYGQSTIISENMGTATSTTAIASHTFQNSPTLTFTGTADVRNTTASTGYSGSSGLGNVFFGTSGGNAKEFLISGINTTNYTDISLSFGVLATTANNMLVVEYSTDGTNYSSLTVNSTITANTWSLKTASGSIPSTSNLRLKFSKNSTVSFRLDDVKLTGTAEPTSNSSSLNFTSVSTTGFTINWTSGNGANRIVVLKSGSAVDFSPADGTSYTANSIFGSGAELGTGNYVVYNSNGNSVAVAGLSAGTTYHVAVYEYNGSGTAVNYLTTSPLTGSRSTLAAEPTTQSTSLSFENIAANTFDLSWSNGDGAGRLVVMRASTEVTGSPSDGVAYTADPEFLQGATIGSGNYVVYSADGNSVSVSGLSPNTRYYVKIFEYNGSGSTINYLLTDPLSGNELTGQSAEPNVVISHAGLTERTLHGAVINLELNNESFNTENIQASNFSLTPSNVGISISAVSRSSETTATCTLSYNDAGNDFDLDIENFSITVNAEILTSSESNLTSNSLTITAIIETAPQVSSNASVTAITASTATLGGTISSDGGEAVIQKGVVWKTSSGPTVSDSKTEEGAGTGIITGNMTGLSPNTTYYVRAYATNSVGTGYGAERSFTTDGLGTPPTANAASNITSTGFTANWGSVAGASSYRLDVAVDENFIPRTTDLLISEYVEGSSNNKYIEIFNGTGSSVDLSNYELRMFANGSATTTSSEVLSGTLNNGAVLVLKNSSATLVLPDGVIATNNAAVNYNGDDALALYKTSSASNVDIFGKIGNDPGSAWTSGSITTVDKTLRRKNSVIQGVIVNPTGTGVGAFTTLGTEWDQFNTDVVSGLGSHDYGIPSMLANYNNLEVGATFQTVAGLNPGTTYYYRVRGFSANSTSGNSGVITVRTADNSQSASVITGNNVSATVTGATGVERVLFTSVATAGNINVARFNEPPTGGTSGITGNISQYRLIIEPDNVLVFDEQAGYKLRFKASDLPGITTRPENLNTTSVRLHKRSTPGSGDFSAAITMTYYRNEDPALDYLESDLITNGFSEFIFSSPDQPLPVELVSFTAKVKSSAVHLQWETATEVNNYGFEVERSNAAETMNASSTQGRTWQKIGFVEGNGNSNSPKSYSFTDRNASAGKYIYRLKQVDTDGAFDYSDEVAVDLGTPAQFSLSQNYPNPFNPSTLVQYAVPVQSVVVLEIYDITGTRVAQPVNALHEPGSYSALFNLTDLNLASGTYIYRLSATDMSGNIMYSAINKMLLLK